MNAINEIVGTKDQSSLNRFLHSNAGDKVKENYINELSEKLRGHSIDYVLTDSWYISTEMIETIEEVKYVGELKHNRWAYKMKETLELPELPRSHGGSRYQKIARKMGEANRKK